jgi:hypothetical protein
MKSIKEWIGDFHPYIFWVVRLVFNDYQRVHPGDGLFARKSLNNNIEELMYGSYLADTRFETAPADGFPRRQWSSLPV